MKVAVIYNKDLSEVINVFGMQNRETYSPRTVEMVAGALEKGGHNVKIIDGNKRVVDELETFMPRVMAGELPGMVFNMAYGIRGQSRYTHVPAFREMLGCPYVGSNPSGHAMALDKVMSKVLFEHAGLPTPKFRVYNGPHEVIDGDIDFWPVIIKPKMEAVSFGLKIVDNETDLREAVEFIVNEFRQQALVEQFVPGREFAIGLLGNDPPETLPIVEIDLEGDPNAIQTVDDKRKTPRGKICPAELDEEKANEMRRAATGAFQALGLYDFSRVDFRMDGDGNIYLLEINSMASLGRTGSYPHAASVAGYNYDALVNRMLEVAVERYFGKPRGGENVEGAAEKAAEKARSQPLEVRVRNHVRKNLPTMLDNLRTMVEINSHARNPEGVNRLGRFISGRLSPLGFQLQVHPQLEYGDVLAFTNHSSERHDILLLGHLDSSFGIQDYTPYRDDRGKLYGSGIAETKGGLSNLVAALQALRFTRSIKKVKIGVLLVTDATLGGKQSRKLIEDRALRSRHVLGLNPVPPGGGIIDSASGAMQFRIELTNRKDNDTQPADVVGMTCQKVANWQKLSVEGDGVTIRATSIDARTMRGQVPDQSAVTLAVRFHDADAGRSLEEQIRKIAEKGAADKLRVNIRKGSSQPPRKAGENSATWAEQVIRIANKLTVKVEPIHSDDPSSICFVPAQVPALDGLGPVAEHVRTPGEFILRDSLVDRASLLAMVIRRTVEASS